MTERPILFSGPTVRAILEGRKTQTRRIVKPRRCPNTGCELACCEIAGERGEHLYRLCPYGGPGSRLWVRETWNTFEGWAGYFYAADDHSFGIGADDDPDHVPEHAVRWRPSIHMPRAASRITLEITEVSVERLQDISEADAQAEGCAGSPLGPAADLLLFPTLWESINGAGSWSANPWVWVIGFRRMTP